MAVTSYKVVSKKRRRHMIETALQIFSETGYDKVTMAYIVEKAGVSTGSIYHHFESKEQLAAAVYIEGIDDYQKGLIAAVKDNPPGRDGLLAIIGFHIRWVRDNPLWAKFLLRMRHMEFMKTSEETMKRRNREFAKYIGGWFENQVNSGVFRPVPSEVYIPIMLGPCQEFTRWWLSRGFDCDIEMVIEEITEAAWRSFQSHNSMRWNDEKGKIGGDGGGFSGGVEQPTG